MKRQAEIELDAGGPVKLVRFSSRERMSELFTIDAEVIVEQRTDFLPHLGKPALIQLFELEQPVRAFHAQVSEAHLVDKDDRGWIYRLVLRPWLHLLEHNRAYRIFEQKSVVQIIREVLQDHSRHVDYSKLTATYQPWPYCTQYCESDFAFVSRLMEREGIYYYFRHENNDHILVLADGSGAHPPATGYETVKLRTALVSDGGYSEALWDWREHVSSRGETSVLMQSFDYEQTKTQKGSIDGAKRNLIHSQEVHEFTGDFVDPSIADHWAKVRLEAARARQRLFTASGDAMGLACGGSFTLDSRGSFEGGERFIITAMSFDVDAEPVRSGEKAQQRRLSLEAAPRDTQWRAPITTPWPVAGPETAIVVTGGADDSNVDSQGRVRVRFLWNKSGEDPDKARSCWLRVSHPSAGAGFGHVALPRTDQEVIVDFLDGNPDRPIVTGRVYNSEHRHTYDLPLHRTRSLFRTDTIGSVGSYAGAESSPEPPGYNELRFEDKGGDEQVYLRAGRNRLLEVLLDDEEQVRRDRTVRVGRDRKTSILHDDSTTIETGDFNVKVLAGAATVEAMQNITLRVGTNSINISEIGITLSVGASEIMLTPAGILINGLTITGEAETTLTLNGSVSTLGGEATLNLVGAIINLIGVPNFE